MELDLYGQLRPGGDRQWLASPSKSLARTCPFSPTALDEDELAASLFPDATRYPTIGRMVHAYVGHVNEPGFRSRGSSGGMVSWVLEELLRRCLVDGVAHVIPTGDSRRFFKYRIARTVDEIREGAKSRYYPVEASEILTEIAQIPGRYAVVGVPCFIKSVQLVRREVPVFNERIKLTLGLFCGHMKSARFIESFAEQMKVDLAQVTGVEFRVKDPNRPASTYTAQFTMRDGSEIKRDWWNLAEGDWGSGFFQYSACNYCDDVIGETADISFGDAWVEPYSSDGRGTNVVVVRSAEVDHIIREAICDGRLSLEAVDDEFVVATQAAGFRQRREGLAYRLTWPKSGYKPRKRVKARKPDDRSRRLVYRMRSHISRWSHRMKYLSTRLGTPQLYLWWSHWAVGAYHALAYHRGKLGALLERAERLTKSRKV
jgi:coenzyme F420-reducing hydrogenase beta subunit